MAEMLSTNANLMIRTACLLVVNNLFAASSASFGTEMLAANAVLLQVLALMSFLIDGMANGNSLFVGRAVGRGDQALFEQTRRMPLKWLVVLVLLLVGLYGLSGNLLLGIFTGHDSVLQLARQYDFYVMAYPFCAGLGLIFYGSSPVSMGIKSEESVGNKAITAIL
jgi:MATE family multidrug resistance protein